MYKMTKNEIEMYVTTIHNAYPYAPEAAMNDMRERFEELVLADNLLSEANATMDTLNTAILINNLSRNHLTNEMAFTVIEHFNDEQVIAQIHSEWPDEQMEERIQIAMSGTFNCPTITPVYRHKQLRRVSAPKNSKVFLPNTSVRFVRQTTAV